MIYFFRDYSWVFFIRPGGLIEGSSLQLKAVLNFHISLLIRDVNDGLLPYWLFKISF